MAVEERDRLQDAPLQVVVAEVLRQGVEAVRVLDQMAADDLPRLPFALPEPVVPGQRGGRPLRRVGDLVPAQVRPVPRLLDELPEGFDPLVQQSRLPCTPSGRVRPSRMPDGQHVAGEPVVPLPAAVQFQCPQVFLKDEPDERLLVAKVREPVLVLPRRAGRPPWSRKLLDRLPQPLDPFGGDGLGHIPQRLERDDREDDVVAAPPEGVDPGVEILDQVVHQPRLGGFLRARRVDRVGQEPGLHQGQDFLLRVAVDPLLAAEKRRGHDGGGGVPDHERVAPRVGGPAHPVQPLDDLAAADRGIRRR